MTSNSFSILQWNMRGYNSQRPFLQDAIDNLSPQILALQETHLNEKSQPYLSGYHLPLRKDRADRKGGGVALFIKKSVAFVPLNFESDLEIIAAELIFNNRKVFIYNLYIPPSTSSTQLQEILCSLKETLKQPFLLTTDANCHHEKWGSPIADNKGKIFAEWLETNDLALLNTGEPTHLTPTGNFTHIDLTICSPDLAPLFSWLPYSDPCNSDHFPLIIQSLSQIPDEFPHTEKWNLKTADWIKYQSSLNLPTNFLSPTQACGAIATAILTAAGNSIKKSKPITRPSAYWWNQECAIAKKGKNHALNQYRKHKGNLDLWIEFKKCRAIFRKKVGEAKRASWKQFLSKITQDTSTQQVWKHLNMLRSRAVGGKVVLREDGELIVDQSQVADKLALHFSKRSNGISHNNLFNQYKAEQEKKPVTFSDNNNTPYNKPISFKELKTSLLTCISNSPGPDSIPYAFIHNMTEAQLKLLLQFFNYIFKTGFPHQWREGYIIPLLKSNLTRYLCTSFRPITLINCLSKIYEKILNRRLQHFLEKHNFYSPYQSGFRAGHSTLDGLIRYQHSANSALREGKFCVAAFIDISSAFDTVWHHGVLSILRDLGLVGRLAKFINDFLSLRKVAVRLGNKVSPSYPLHSGVPQGSVLSPTLFSVLINSIFQNNPPTVENSLYADDGAIWTVSADLRTAIESIQTALNHISSWSDKWGLCISENKTKAMITSYRRADNPIALHIKNKQIQFVKHVRFLGVIFDNRLTWKIYIEHLKNRCQKDLQLLKIISLDRNSSDYSTLKTLYNSLTLSKINYASFLYTNAAHTHLEKLNRIQRAAARLMLGAMRNTAGYKLETEADLMPLEQQRKLQLLHYGSRISTIQNHPVRNLLLNHNEGYKFLSENHKLSALDSLHKELTKLNLHPHCFSSIPMTNQYVTNSIKANHTLADKAKDQRSPEHWKQLFGEMIATQYQGHHQIYTDGSVREHRAGCAVWSPGSQIASRLPDNTGIFTAELHAIFLALKHCTSGPHKYLILTDSLSAIKAIQSYKLTKHYILSDIHNLTTNKDATIEWIPSHIGIPGNELADRTANIATNLPIQKTIPTPRLEMRRCMEEAVRLEWRMKWRGLGERLTKFKPLIGPTAFVSLPRRSQVIMSRLRLATTNLTHGHFFQRGPPSTCRYCNSVYTLRHVFITCPNSSTQREKLINQCTANNKPFELNYILSPEFPPELVLGFLQEVGLKAKI